MKMSAKGHPSVYNEQQGNPHTTGQLAPKQQGNPNTTGQAAAGPKTTLYTGTTNSCPYILK